jgi:hypothetical protein
MAREDQRYEQGILPDALLGMINTDLLLPLLLQMSMFPEPSFYTACKLQQMHSC